jgi:hypothetical protein
MKRQPRPQTEVLAWLFANHPALHKAAEIDRAWLWLPVDLRGEHNKPTREAIKEYGFIFSRRGGHPLPSGKLGMWGHSCEAPLPFNKKSRKQKQSTDLTIPDNEVTDEEAAAFALS